MSPGFTASADGQMRSPSSCNDNSSPSERKAYKRCKQYEEPKLDCGLPDRSFSITEDDDGICDIRLRLPVEEGVLIHHAVERMVDETRAGEANDPRPDNKNVSAETFLNVRHAALRDLTCDSPGADCRTLPRQFEQRRTHACTRRALPGAHPPTSSGLTEGWCPEPSLTERRAAFSRNQPRCPTGSCTTHHSATRPDPS